MEKGFRGQVIWGRLAALGQGADGPGAETRPPEGLPDAVVGSPPLRGRSAQCLS